MKDGDGFINIHESPFLSSEVSFRRFVFKSIYENFNLVRPFDCFLWKHHGGGKSLGPFCQVKVRNFLDYETKMRQE